MEEILNPAKCIDCGEIYELDGLDLDLRCEGCVEQWEIDELEGEPCDECGAIHDEEDEAMTIKEVGEPIYIGRGKA
jgi:hypothetical protein